MPDPRIRDRSGPSLPTRWCPAAEVTSRTTRLIVGHPLVIRSEIFRAPRRAPGPVRGHRVLAGDRVAARPGDRRCGRRPDPHRERTSASSTTGHCQMSRSSPARVSSSRAIASASPAGCPAAPGRRPRRSGMPSPGPGKGWRRRCLGDARVRGQPWRTSSLKSRVSGRPARTAGRRAVRRRCGATSDVRGARAAAGLDDVRDRACPGRGTHRVVRRPACDDRRVALLEDADELASDDLALLSGSLTPASADRNAPGVDDHVGRRRSRRRSRSRPARLPPAATRGRRRRVSWSPTARWTSARRRRSPHRRTHTRPDR